MNNNLCMIAGVADLIGLTPGTVKLYLTKGKLPEPDVAVGHVKLWKESTIIEWDRERLKRYDNRKNRKRRP